MERYYTVCSISRKHDDLWVVARGGMHGYKLKTFYALFNYIRQCMGRYYMVCSISRNHGDYRVVAYGEMHRDIFVRTVRPVQLQRQCIG